MAGKADRTPSAVRDHEDRSRLPAGGVAGRLLDRVRAAPHLTLCAGVLAAAAYLCLVNLDYAALWHDEAPIALIGRNLLQQGDITGWDGRNLVGGTNGRTLNEHLRDVLPPLMYAVNAASFGLLGVSETAARIGPALFGIASLALLYLLLRQHLANHPRLILFALALAAWSPQLLLYYRQSRYFARAPGLPRRRPAAGGGGPRRAHGRAVALFSAALSSQPVWVFDQPFTDLRYYMGALPLLLVMKGLFVEWAWRRRRVAGAAALAVLLCSSAGAWPINMRNVFTGERTLGLHLLQFVREIHRPYRDSIRTASDYLLEHAEQDDLVFVPAFHNREALTFTTGHRVLFCCVLDEQSPLPAVTVASLGAHLAVEGAAPNWIVLFGELSEQYWNRVKARYDLAAQPAVHHYPTQRPEINLHAFAPLPAAAAGMHVLRRKAAEASGRDGP